jgi:hypothetical protein
MSDTQIVTERVVFDALARRGHNTVLQDNRRVTDDGSLSVYCGKANVRYGSAGTHSGSLSCGLIVAAGNRSTNRLP